MNKRNDIELASAVALARLPPADLAQLNTEQLRQELSAALRVTAESLRRLAWIVRLLEERGEDLSDLRLGLLTYLRKIAHGQVLPELVVRFADSPELMRTASALPLPDQVKLARGEPVPFVVRTHEGKTDIRLADPLKMDRNQLRQVFGRGRIRDESEQALFLDADRPKSAKASSALKLGGIQVDRTRGGLKIGRHFVTAGQIVLALSELAGPDESDQEQRTFRSINVPMTDEEFIALKNSINRSNTSIGTMIRRLCRQAGLLTGA